MIPGDYAGYMIRGNIITEKGKKIIEEAKCRRCHTVGGEGGVKASNLDSSSERLPPDKLLDAIENPNDNMPDFRLDTENLKALMSGLYFYASGSVVMEMTQTVHFIGEEKDGTFHKKCGGCHKALTAEGAAGTYKWGPNLSGIGEKDDYGINGVQWDEELLEKWLRNSRDVKKNSAMPPADLTEEELRSVIRTLTGNR